MIKAASTMIAKLKKWWRSKQKQPVIIPVKVMTPMEEIDLLRKRIEGVGWRLREIPIHSGTKGFRVVAARGERTVSTDGISLHHALVQLGKILGVR